MGEIADMHVEAFAAGLDPNEMDGADWADFYADEEEPPTADEIASNLCIFFVRDVVEAGQDGETLAQTMQRIFPALTAQQAEVFEGVVEALDAFPDD